MQKGLAILRGKGYYIDNFHSRGFAPRENLKFKRVEIMNKSKFLKKSLAMLLALMLVFAMIPLSASAAEGESVYFKDLYVDGQRAAVNGDQLSSDVVETTKVDLTVGTLYGAELYVDVKNTENDRVLPIRSLDLTDETVATKTGDNKYQVGILVKVKDNPESDDARLVEKYTLTITVEEIKEGDDVLLRGLAAGETTWANMASYEVIHPEDNGGDTGLVNITLKFGYDEPTLDLGLTEDFDAIDPTSEVYVVDQETIRVESQLGSSSNYKLAYTWQAAFESFTIPGQTGETEFVWDGQAGNKININVPYAYNFSEVIPTFEFANDVDHVKGMTAPSNDWIYSDYTVLEKVSGWSNTAAAGVNWKNQATLELSVPRGNDWAYITLTITGVAKNPEGDLKTIQISDKFGNESNTTDAKVGTFEVEMPKDTQITNNTFTVTMVASRDAKVVYIDGKTTNEVAVDEDLSSTTSQYEFDITTGEDEDAVSFTIQVTPEAGGATKNYNVNMTTPEIAKAQLKSLIVSNGTESYEAEINQTTGVVRLTIPYAWSNSLNTGDVKIYMKASTGATITHDATNSTFPHEGYVNFNASSGDPNHWLPKIDGDPDKNETPSVIKVADSDPATKDENTYKIYVETAPAKTERKISDVTFVGTDKPYEITPSNTYETKIGEATLNGEKVRTIEVTVPYSYDKEPAYISDWTISDGAVAYYVDDVNFSENGQVSIIGTNSENNTPTNFGDLTSYIDSVENGVITGAYRRIYVLSEEYAVPEMVDRDGNKVPDGYLVDENDYLGKKFTDKQNVSIYYLVAKRAPAETGHEMLSIESTVDKNVTATLEGTTITINVPASYAEKETKFSLNFELSKLAELYGLKDKLNLITSDNGSAQTTGRTMFWVDGDDDNKLKYDKGGSAVDTVNGKLYVYSESGNQSQAYDVKVNVNKPETGASITALSVNGTAGTITQDKINVRLPLGSKLYPVTLDIEASKMAKVEIGGKAYNPENKYDVNDEVEITVTSENGEVVNNYYLNVTVSDSFNDVSSSEWYYDEVMTAANAGWINGTKPGYFEPNGTMTRADFMVIIARILDCDTEATVESLFPDCNETDYFNAAVTFCKQRGIIDGDDKGYFNPYDAITREEMAKILCNALELDELETSANPFDDDAEIAQWAKGYVNAVQAEGIMEGSNGSFNPRDNATRAEGAAVLVRAFA